MQIGRPVELTEIASFHVDETAAEPSVAVAVTCLPAAAAGDEDARLTVDGVEDYDLLWFATQELSDLL